MDFGHCPEITVYSGCCLFPPAEQLTMLWAENKKPLLSMIVEVCCNILSRSFNLAAYRFLVLHRLSLHFNPIQVHKGVRGVVRDKSRKPIVGAIIVLNGGVRVFSGEQGYFHALLAPGNHNIEAVADGYQQQRQEVHSYAHTPCIVQARNVLTPRKMILM